MLGGGALAGLGVGLGASLGAAAVARAPAPVQTPAATTTRLRPIRPARVLDTRSGGNWWRVDRQRLRVPVAGRAGVPTTAVAAVVVVTAHGAPSAGFVSVQPAGDAPDRPRTTLIHHGAADPHTQAAFVLLGRRGALDVHHEQAGTVVTVDVVGYFETARSSADGRVVARSPERVLDTRATADPFERGEMRPLRLDGVIPPTAGAVLVTLSAGGDGSGGSWTVAPDGPVPAISNLLATPGRSRSSLALVATGNGALQVRSSGGGHIVVDVIGHVTGPDDPVSTDGLFVPTPPVRVLDTRFGGGVIQPGDVRELTAGPDPHGGLAISIAAASAADGEVFTWPAGAAAPATGGLRLHGPGVPASAFSVAAAGPRGLAIGTTGTRAHVVVDRYGWFVGEPAQSATPVAGALPYGIADVPMETLADEWLDYGTSTEGRPLRAFRVGDGPRSALLTSGIHGDELTGTSVLADIAARGPIPGWTLWLVPIANPDARAITRRFTHDVDMNRDFPVGWDRQPTLTGSGCITTRTGPHAASLPETRAMIEAMGSGPFHRCSVSISHHDNYNWVAPQRDSPAVLRTLADDYARATGLRLPGQGGAVVPTSPNTTRVPGGFETYAHHLGMRSLLVENKAGYVAGRHCAGSFGVEPTPDDVAVHYEALWALLTDARLP